MEKLYDVSYTQLGYEDLRNYIFNNFIKKYFPSSYNNFNSNLSNDSLAKMLLETTVAIGDILNFYINDTYKETNIDTAEQEQNVWALAKQEGYVPKLTKASTVHAYVYFTVPATGSSGENVNIRYTPILKAGSGVVSNNGIVFELEEDVNMSGAIDSTTDQVIANSSGGNPTYYALRQVGKFIAGKTTSADFTITGFERFKRIALSEANVIDVIDVWDTNGNKYYKVDDLAQDYVYERIINNNSDSSQVPYILNLRKVPYRFVVDVDPITSTTYIQFGAGNTSAISSSLLIPNPAMYAVKFKPDSDTLPVTAINPEYFTGSLSLGIVPASNITVRYRVGGGIDSNVGANDIRDPYDINTDFVFTGLNSVTQNDVINSFSVLNFEAADGGGDKDDVDLIKYIAKFNRGAQKRIVTPEDYIARILSMPSSFGSIYKCAVEPLNDSNTVRVYILGKDSNSNLTLSSRNLKENVRTWLSQARLLSEGVEIIDGEIINLKLYYRVLVDKKYNSNKVLTNCNIKLKEQMNIDKRQMGEAIVMSRLSDVLDQQDGVYGVDKIYFTEDYSLNYPSISRFKVKRYLKNNVLYIPPYGCAEIRNINSNIIGASV